MKELIKLWFIYQDEAYQIKAVFGKHILAANIAGKHQLFDFDFFDSQDVELFATETEAKVDYDN